MNKRGISPVIATVLLIAMVIVIGLIVFLWFRGIVQEEGTKFGKNVKLVCADVKFDASYSDSTGILSIVNTGRPPIYRMKMKISKEGSHSTKEIEGDWPALGLNQGGAFSENINSEISGANKITLIPVLMSKEKKAYVCEEQYGYEIEI